MNSQALYDEFTRVWPWLDASLASFGRTHTKDQIWQAIVRGNATLWPSDNAVILSNLIRHPIGLTSCNIWLQGGDLPELKTMHPQLEDWAKDRGCHRMIAWGRDGWVKVMAGWERCGTRRAKWLTDVPDYLKATKR